MTASTLPSSSELHWDYDLYMSYSTGGDTRKTFVDPLCSALVRAGIHICWDDIELVRGEEISSKLHDAIQGSRISIVVFSESYASSRCCLDELVEILHCKKTKGCFLLPIFYHVDPSNIRKQSTGTFAEAFARHEEWFGRDMERVQRWREALVEVANIPGWDTSDENGIDESMLVEKVVSKVLDVMNAVRSDVAMHPRIEDSPVEEIKTLLSLGTSDDVRIVGIYGMAGIGKTSLATAVYNQVHAGFEGSSFLSNIREISKEPNVLAYLQEQLLSDILVTKNLKIDNVVKGIILMKKKLKCKRVLVVLDDVDHLIQLEVLAGCSKWFGPGSRVIATTRDGCLLNQMQVNAKYRVEARIHLESLPLFGRTASNIPPLIEDIHELMIAEAAKYHSGWHLKSAATGGKDIRKTFLGHLKSALELAGIRVFLDCEKLERGENIPTGLLKAIGGSRISIVVFSKGYAYSKWCLNELVEILHCTKTNGHSLIPIFHIVKPTHVRHQTGEFGQAFVLHENDSLVDAERVRSWRETLTDCSGRDLESYANGYEAVLIAKVLEDILCKVSVVGIDSSTKTIKDLLKLGTTEVRTVGIYGKAGMGKTTLAKVFYKQICDRFDGSSFLRNIEEISKQPDGEIQKRLLRDILKMENLKIGNIHEGIDSIKESLQGKKVLVLDKVNHMKQLHALAGNSEWLGPGSRILATTRDEVLLTRLGVHGKFQVEELNYWTVDTREGYLELSIRAVEHAGGVPLALKALGSFLLGRSIDVWKRVLEYLENKSSQGDPLR
ncbi:disease resistance protein RPV1-like [Juglans microcarpa x Juglans regia]|uniref:disease resistance protein RPV1-like n=1 Tax=Juglans microcarpa x Juglans regia TaxID=2249226 RepID=UPI001B7E5984|nr:disease resistance protein RPV1-like [Juglans microcarpa x Juglans regia]